MTNAEIFSVNINLESKTLHQNYKNKYLGAVNIKN